LRCARNLDVNQSPAGFQAGYFDNRGAPIESCVRTRACDILHFFLRSRPDIGKIKT
jgi:hypothetical protein